MKYLHLILAALLRSKIRTVLTLVSIVAAFLLFGMLNSVRSAFASGSQSLQGVSRLVTSSRYSIIQPLPLSLKNEIQRVPGVSKVAYANWFGGAYQDPKKIVFTYAISSNYLDLYPSIELPSSERKAFDRTRTGAVVGAELAKRNGWKVGQQVPLQSNIFPQKDGSKTWTFDIVGIFKAGEGAPNGIAQSFFLHWKYFDEGNAFGQHQVGWYVDKITDPAQADSVSHAIDALSANSAHETRTQTEQAFQASFAKQIGNIGLIVVAIMGAVFFTLVLLTGNTMAQAVRERTSELAVLKTIGFSSRSVLSMVLAESVLLLLTGGCLGLGIAALLGPIVTHASAGVINMPPLGLDIWITGVLTMLVIGLLVGALPAIRAMRLNIVDALARR